MTIVDIVGENEKIVVAWTFSGTHDGEIMGNPATHKKVSVDGITIHHFANGKVIDSYASWDLQSLTKQLGGTISQYRLIEKLGGGGRASSTRARIRGFIVQSL